MDRYLTEAERYPLLSDAGRAMLRRLRQHPHGPRFNYEAGERLTADGLARVRAYDERLRTELPSWRRGERPAWVRPFVLHCLETVPWYRRWACPDDPFLSLPTVTRDDLARAPWEFVPDDAPLDDLITYPTSGTTGHPLLVVSHPEAAALYVPLLRRALALHGVTLEGGPGRVAAALVGWQKRTYTFTSVCSLLGEAGFVKLNLHPGDWRRPEDRAAYLDDLAPEVVSGDPVTFRELARLPLTARPKALVSTAMMLLPGLRRELEERFGCPVIDLYSLTEAGPVAVATGRGHEVLPPDLYVEVLRPDGTPCAPRERGEIALTGGRNPFLPLVRYRTGDWAALDFAGPVPTLVGLEGRPPTVFRSATGEEINNIDVTWALRPLALARFALHQDRDGSLTLKVRPGEVPETLLRQALGELFGPELPVRIEELPETPEGKLVQYTRTPELAP